MIQYGPMGSLYNARIRMGGPLKQTLTLALKEIPFVDSQTPFQPSNYCEHFEFEPRRQSR